MQPNPHTLSHPPRHPPIQIDSLKDPFRRSRAKNLNYCIRAQPLAWFGPKRCTAGFASIKVSMSTSTAHGDTSPSTCKLAKQPLTAGWGGANPYLRQLHRRWSARRGTMADQKDLLSDRRRRRFDDDQTCQTAFCRVLPLTWKQKL